MVTIHSTVAGNSDLERGADLPHTRVAQPAESLDEGRERHTFDRIEIHDGRTRYGVLARLE